MRRHIPWLNGFLFKSKNGVLGLSLTSKAWLISIQGSRAAQPSALCKFNSLTSWGDGEVCAPLNS